MSRKPKADTDHIFIIRLWREPNGTRSDGSWRGQLYYRNRRHHFVGLRQLFTIIRDTPDESSAVPSNEKPRRRNHSNGVSTQG